MRTTITSLLTSFTVIIATLLSSCVRDLDGGKEQQVIADDDMALVTLSLSVPAPPASRTEPGTLAEDKVEAIDVLLFTNDADEYFRYRASGTGITDAGIDPDPVHATKTFTVRLPYGTYKVVLLANARAAINASTYKTQLVPATLYTSG
ncbi:MAG: hypothetical protein LBF09_05385, partial [Odoribacteraceae bacterium]|nr:hypothetical protein [Odoribacteraceae bacterium]